MVSASCRVIVKDELKKLGLHFVFIDLGEVDIMENLSPDLNLELKKNLLAAGFELLDDKRSVLIEKITAAIIEMVHYNEEFIKVNFSDYLSDKLKRDYTYLANLFSEVQGTTIEQFVIAHKVERVKELLIYGELNVTEIAWKMNYSSVAHLSNQFKKVTGLTPSFFRNMADKKRLPLEDVGIVKVNNAQIN